jgi:hypothetical protein
MSRTVLLLGIVGRSPVAGVAWQALHYVEALRRLGHDVYYLEDTGVWPYDGARATVTDDPTWVLDHLGRVMERAGMSERWAYVSGVDGSTHGMSTQTLSSVTRRADVMVNVTGSAMPRDWLARVPVRIYVETDPVVPQIQAVQGDPWMTTILDFHTHLFTFGENIGAPDCGVPVTSYDYRPTRQPVVVDWWPDGGLEKPRPPYTTIMNWRQSGKDVEWQGETYGWSKHAEFEKYLDLPARSGRSFELAIASHTAADAELLTEHGWRVVGAEGISSNLDTYRRYIASSHGEFTTAKDQNVRLRSGWFSDRSACYLAAGRPVITQDTGFGKFVPTGKGLFAFTTADDILAAVDQIDADYIGNSRAAREIAASHFGAEGVVGRLLQDAGV